MLTARSLPYWGGRSLSRGFSVQGVLYPGGSLSGRSPLPYRVPPPPVTRITDTQLWKHYRLWQSCFFFLSLIMYVINLVINKFKISFRQKDIWGCLSYKIPWTEFSRDFVVYVIKLSCTSLYILTLTINFFQTIPMTQAKLFTESFNSVAENYFQQWSRSTKRANNNWRIAAYGPVLY